MRITVVGAGVSGLTTAVALQDAGHDVSVVARAVGAATTSGAAGAVWYPFRADPPDRVIAWARDTRAHLIKLAESTPEAGVDVLTMYELVDLDDEPWWAPCVDGLELVNEGFRYPAKAAWRFQAPRVDPPIHLVWLESLLHRPVTIAEVASLDDLDGDLVVNCTGLGARALTGDESLIAIFGQTVIVEGGTFDRSVVLSDERPDAAMFYAIPRRAEVLLGGCAIECPDDRALVADPALRDAILERARQAGYDSGPVLREKCGLRPYRSNVRLEREGRIIHNYGHGGAGFTLAHGCAQEVVSLANA